MIKYLIALILVVAAPLPAQAEWSQPFEVDYVMGDGDTRSSAREAALDQLKLKASNAAGTYVQSTTTLSESGELTETIKTVGASMVRITQPVEKVYLNEAGLPVLKVKATASLDESELRHRVEALQRDDEKAKQVLKLQKDNEALRLQLAHIRNELSKNADPSTTARLLSKQDKTIHQIEENGRTVSQVFEGGTLLQLAGHNSSELDKAKRDLEVNFFSIILKTPVTAEVESVNGSDNDYVAQVRVGWDIDTMKARQQLERYVKVNGYNGNLYISKRENTNGNGPGQLSEQVFRYLSTRTIALRLQIGERSVNLPVFYVDSQNFADCSAYSVTLPNRVNLLCLVSQQKDSADLRGADGHSSNPVKIHLTNIEAARATRVDATLVSYTK